MVISFFRLGNLVTEETIMYYRFILSNNGNVATIGKYRYHLRFFVRVGHKTTYMPSMHLTKIIKELLEDHKILI